MTCINIYDPFAKERRQLDFDLNSSLCDLRETLKKQIGIPKDQQRLIFHGDCLNDDNRSLASYGISRNGTIFLLKKHDDELKVGQNYDIPMDEISIDEIEQLLSKARNPIFRQSIRKFVRNKENIEKIISDSDILKNDPMLKSLLGDPDLIIGILDTGKAEKIVEEHPTLGTALKLIIAKGSVTSSRPPLLPAAGANDEFDDMDLSSLSQAELVASSSQGQSNDVQQQQISATDLANALSIASMGVQTDQNSSTTSSQTLNEEQMTSALEQMRAVGITSDAMSRQALIITGGNVEAAINIIFEGTLSRMFSD